MANHVYGFRIHGFGANEPSYSGILELDLASNNLHEIHLDAVDIRDVSIWAPNLRMLTLVIAHARNLRLRVLDDHPGHPLMSNLPSDCTAPPLSIRLRTYR